MRTPCATTCVIVDIGGGSSHIEIRQKVFEIIEDVRDRCEDAVLELAARYDRWKRDPRLTTTLLSDLFK